MFQTVKRTSEIEEFTNFHFIHPISWWLVPKLALKKITPNMVSLAGMIFGILAGVAYYFYAVPGMAVVGFACMLLWHIMDGTDGQLARYTKNQSELGMVLDGVCDYVTFITVYVGIALALQAQFGPQIWYVVLAAGALHAIQSGAYEVQRGEYDYWGHGKPSSGLPDIKQMIADLDGKSFVPFLASQLHIGYVRMQRLCSGVDQDFRRTLAAALRDNPDREEDIRALYREIFAPGVKFWSVLSANYRTLAIFIACVLMTPVYYFWFEILFLTPVMLLLVQKQKRLNQLFLRRLKEIL